MSFTELKLVDVLDFFNGKAPPKTHNGAYPIFGSNGQIGRTDKFNHEQAVIIGRVGAYCGSIEVCEGKFWASDNTIVVKPKQDNDLNYFYYKLGSMPLRGYAGRAAQPLLTQGVLKSVRSIFADTTTQKEISQLLKKYDNLIENNKRRIELLEESARQLYKEWFVRFRFPGYEHVKIIDGVPEGWNTGVISDFYKTSSGGTPSRKIPEYYTGEINWVKTQELGNGFIFETSEKITEDAIKKSSAKLFPKNTVLVAMYGATIGQFGILANESATNQACCALISNSSVAHYIYAYLFLKENKDRLIGRSKGAAQNNISQDIVKNFDIVMPPEPLMEQFIDYADPIFSQIKILSLEITKLTTARDLLLPKLMNGEIAV